MGRELKRVPLDFDYPIGKVWSGYLNPYRENKCTENCEGGYSEAYRILEKYFYNYNLTEAEAENELFKKFLPLLTPEVISKRKQQMGHNLYGLLREFGENLNLKNDWMLCKTCSGHGIDPDYLEQYENWERRHPPKGEGFQLWETTSEGSPKSPVFETLDALCEWCEENATTFGSLKATKEEWKKMLDDNFVYTKKDGMIFL